MFSETLRQPKNRIWRATLPCGSTNCGRNARRNKAVFGFNASTTTPCRKAFPCRRTGPSAPGASACASDRSSSVRVKVDKVGRACQLHDRERCGRGHQDGGEPECGCGDVDEAAQGVAQGGSEPLAAPALQAAREHVEDAGPGRDGDDRGGGEEQREGGGVGHKVSHPVGVLGSLPVAL